MRISYLGNFGPLWSTENDVRLAFEGEGHEVVCLQENNVSYSELRRQALISDLLLITSTWDEAHPLDESLTTFKNCADHGIPTVSYHLDTFHPVSRNDRRWWLNPMFHTAHVFTADGDWPEKWAAMGVNHHWLPAAVRHTVVEDYAAGKFQSRPEYECDVAFVGSDGIGYHEEWPYRRQLVDQLEAMCAENGWSFLNPGGRQPKIERQHMGDFYASAKVTVGDSLCVNGDQAKYWSDRVYEATGRGGFLIMPEIDELNKQFHTALPMYPWGRWDELELKIEEALQNPTWRRGVAESCFAQTREEHTYRNRVRTILETVL